jgi:hypothetical protein
MAPLALTAPVATIVAAVIVSVAGGAVAGVFALLRDRQEKEARWRSQALELTKLDLERKLRTRAPGSTQPLRPSILDFLANYRDLCELEDRVSSGKYSPAELYELILEKRMARKEEGPPAEGE